MSTKRIIFYCVVLLLITIQAILFVDNNRPEDILGFGIIDTILSFIIYGIYLEHIKE
jgi:hypothetical protein